MSPPDMLGHTVIKLSLVPPSSGPSIRLDRHYGGVNFGHAS